ncbi:MAG: DUF2059 domain-containing protein [Verrucomicrobiota bacterium]|jgi:hypothetical protein
MRFKCLCYTIAAVIVSSVSLYAQEAVSATNASTSLAEEIVSIMHFEGNFDAMKGKMEALLTSQKPAGIPQDAWDRIAKQSQQTMQSVFSAMTWEKMKPVYVSLYAETFTPDELQGLIDFYKTPVGQKYIEKQPQLQAAIMQKSQSMMKDIMPLILKSTPLPTAIGSSNPILPASSGTVTPTP